MKYFKEIIGVLFLAGNIGLAQAEVVALDVTGFLFGSSDAASHPFEITALGDYDVILNDFGPSLASATAFDDLNVAIVSNTLGVLGELTAPGTMSVTFNTLGNYFALVIGGTSGSVGAYGVKVSSLTAQPPVTTVPVPAPLLLLISAIACLLLVRRRSHGTQQA